ncbi:MAG: ATP-binding protein [Terriglobales bacterium]|jgi:two-component system, OmpR family, heavy metal sensor histidine kinase CusS
MKKLSIGFRLTLWYLATFAAAQLFFGVGMWLVLRQDLYSVADDALTAQVDDLTNFLRTQKKKNMTALKLREEASEAYSVEHSGDFLQIYDEDGNWIFRAPSLEQNRFAPLTPAVAKGSSFQNSQLGNKPFRFITQRIDVNGRSYIVQTGVPTDQIIATLSLFRRYLLMLAPLLLLAAASGGYWLSRKALSPVDTITRTARSIGGSNLSDRLEKLTTGDELQRLSDTLNEMLARIEGAFLRVTQFTADASHELRTPISLIRTEAEIALRKSRGTEEYREALRHILLETERTSSLVEELLSLARADSGRENLHLTPLDLRSVIKGTADKWRQLVESRNLQFTQAIADCELPVLADCTGIQRLLAILLDNAVKYTPSPGVVELLLKARDEKAVITVRDSGIGIAEQDQTRIFERFYRVDKARSRELGGAGIGLAIADWIVQQHRGSITVQSSIGNGSTFLIEFQLQPASAVLDLSQAQVFRDYADNSPEKPRG